MRQKANQPGTRQISQGAKRQKGEKARGRKCQGRNSKGAKSQTPVAVCFLDGKGIVDRAHCKPSYQSIVWQSCCWVTQWQHRGSTAWDVCNYLSTCSGWFKTNPSQCFHWRVTPAFPWNHDYSAASRFGRPCRSGRSNNSQSWSGTEHWPAAGLQASAADEMWRHHRRRLPTASCFHR